MELLMYVLKDNLGGGCSPFVVRIPPGGTDVR